MAMTMRPRTTVAGLVAAVTIVTALPYVYAARSSPPDLVYTGLMFDVPDHAQYWSWITASQHRLFISNTMTPEPNAPIFANPAMWTLAQIQQAFGLSLAGLFQGWRVLAILVTVPALVAFATVMVRERERRATAVLLALFGSGLGWTLVGVKKVIESDDVPWPGDLYTVEPNTFWSLLSYPHIALANGLILMTMTSIWLALTTAKKRWWVTAAVAAAVLSVSHAYDLITVYAVLAAYGALVWWQQRTFPLRVAAIGIVVALCSAPAAVYYQQLTASDPLWRSVLSQYANAGVWTPPHVHLIVLMGVPILLAALAAAGRRPRTAERWFVLTWALVSLALIYLPVVYQIKLLSGWQFPIAVLAAHAWHEQLLPRLSASRLAPFATAALLLCVSVTNMYLFAWRFVELRRHTAPYYLHRDQIAGLGWLAAHAQPDDVVLAPSLLGQFVPNYGRSRAYLAHWAMTNRFFERRANVDAFFDHDTPDIWRRQLLERERITYVMWSDWPDGDELRESEDESAHPRRASLCECLLPVFERPHTAIFRVSGAAGDMASSQPGKR
jgi:hypothetical protein